eukprot:8747708-Alexandrium_andersonii.AAC.1
MVALRGEDGCRFALPGSSLPNFYCSGRWRGATLVFRQVYLYQLEEDGGALRMARGVDGRPVLCGP